MKNNLNYLILIILVHLVSISYTQHDVAATTYTFRKDFMPGNIYQIKLQAGESLSFKANWDDNKYCGANVASSQCYATIDLYLYNSSCTDILSPSNSIAQGVQPASTFTQTLNFTATIADIYYVRIGLNNITSNYAYIKLSSITISSNISQLIYYGNMVVVTPISSGFYTVFYNKPSTTNFVIKYNGPKYNISISAPAPDVNTLYTSNVSDTNSNSQIIVSNSLTGDFYVTINHGITTISAASLTAFTFSLSNTVCDTGYLYNTTLSLCVRNCSNDSFSYLIYAPQNHKKCWCRPGYGWSSSIQACKMRCRDDLIGNGSLYCDGAVYMKRQSTYPTNVYKISLQAGNKLRAQLYWPYSVSCNNLDMYLYRSGQNFVSGTTYVASSTQICSINPQNLYFTVLTSGDYYLRVAYLCCDNLVDFSLKLSINGVLQNTYWDTATNINTIGYSIRHTQIFDPQSTPILSEYYGVDKNIYHVVSGSANRNFTSCTFSPTVSCINATLHSSSIQSFTSFGMRVQKNSFFISPALSAASSLIPYSVTLVDNPMNAYGYYFYLGSFRSVRNCYTDPNSRNVIPYVILGYDGGCPCKPGFTWYPQVSRCLQSYTPPSAVPKTFLNVTASFPSNIHPVNVKISGTTTITANLSWTAAATLTLNLYTSVSNYFSSIPVPTTISASSNYVYLTFTASSSASYFLGVNTASTSLVAYNLIVSVNGSVIDTFSESIIYVSGKVVTAFKFDVASPTVANLTFYSWYDNSFFAPINIYSPGNLPTSSVTPFVSFNPRNSLSKFYQISLPYAGIWHIVIESNSYPKTYLQVYSLQVVEILEGVIGTTASCSGGYYVNTKTNSCAKNCSIYPYQIENPGDISSCSCVSNKYIMNANGQCIANCGADPNALSATPIINGDYSTCTCKTNFYYDTAAALCVRNCSNDSASSLTYNASDVSTCSCKTGSNWDPVTYKCYVPCSMPYSSGINPANSNDCLCVSGYQWNNVIKLCVRNCTNVENSQQLYLSSNISQCTCNINFMWVGSLLSCARNCSTDSNSLQTFNTSDITKCQCNSGYFWDPFNKICSAVCSMAYSVGFSSTTQGECECNSDFIWNGSVTKCVRNCSIYSNSLNVYDVSDVSKCACIAGFMWSTSQNYCARDCSLDSNSSGTYDASDVTRCQCKSGNLWNPSSKKCSASCSILYSVGFNTANYNQCSCSTGFIWNSTAGLCVRNCLTVSNSENLYDSDDISKCICKNKYLWVSSRLECTLDCANDPNSLFTYSATNASQCQCSNEFIWDSTISACVKNCQVQKNRHMIYSSCDVSQCVCQTGFVFSLQLWQCVRSCKNDTNSQLTYNNLALDQCSCLLQFYWNTTLSKCVRNCSNDTNSNLYSLLTDVQSCECQAGYKWSPVAVKCVKLCLNDTNSQLTFSQTNVSQCQCVGQFQWSNSQFKCVRNCSLDIYSTLVQSPSDVTICECLTFYIWNETSYKCVRDCDEDTYSEYTIQQGDINACACKQKYTWDVSLLKCVVDCSADSNSNNACSPSDISQCDCKTNFIWNQTLGLCTRDCATDPFSEYVIVDGNINQCICLESFLWNTTTNFCVRNCTNDTLSQLWYSPSDLSRCSCLANYIWNSGWMRCVRNCKNDLYSYGTYSSTSITQCRCLPEYQWNTALQKCVRNCTLDVYSSQTYSTSNIGQCQCIATYAWGTTANKCVRNCANIAFSLLTYSSTDITVCNCKSWYYWIGGSTVKCVRNCTNDTNSLGNFSPSSVGQCQCNNNFVWNASAYKCVRECTFVANSTTFYNTTDVAQCSCVAGYYWNAPSLSCVKLASLSSSYGEDGPLVLGRFQNISAGAIAGIVIGSLLVLGAIAYLVWKRMKKLKPKEKNQEYKENDQQLQSSKSFGPSIKEPAHF